MTPETIAALVNFGPSGVVVAVVIIFLKFLKDRDAQWQTFIHDERLASNGQRKEDRDKVDVLAAGLEKLTLLMGEFRSDFNQHAVVEEARFEVLLNNDQKAEVNLRASENVKRKGR